MFGRSAERAAVLAGLRDAPGNLVSITGRGGIGKTCLALDVVAALRAAGTDVFVVPLAGVSDPDLVVPEIAAARRVVPLPDVDVTDALVHDLADDDVVVVLDSCEHVAGAAAAIGELLDRCPCLRVLVTSQTPLRLRTEHVIALGPLPLDEAVALYCERARAVDRRFALTDENRAAITALCRRLEGLPLAVELAAARAATLPAVDVAARLDEEPLDLLRRERADAPARHQGVRAAIAWTYALLPPEPRRLLRHLSVVIGSFDIDTAEALSGSTATAEVIDQLSVLVDFRLVDPVLDAAPARYSIPASIRAYAAEKLTEAGEDADARIRRVAYHAAVARVGGVGLDRLAIAHDDMLHAIEDALALDLVDDALDIASALGPVWEARGYYDAHERVVARALVQGDGRVTPGYASALAWSAWLALRMRRPATGREPLTDRLRRAEDLSRATGDDDALLLTLSFWMRAAAFTGDFERAAHAAAEGLALAEHPGREPWLARFRVWTGMVAHQIGDADRAVELGRAALIDARRRDDDYAIVIAVMLLGPLAAQYPAIADEVPPTTEALAIARRLGLTLFEPALLALLVMEHLERDDAEAAARWCRESLQLTRSHPATPICAYSLVAAASVASRFGDQDVACSLHGVVRDTLPALAPSMPPEAIATHTQVVARATETIGAERVEVAARRGAHAGWSAMIDEAIEYMGKYAPAPSAVAAGADENPSSLTPRQLEVVRLLAAGLSNKEIAARLGVAPKTVMHHTTGVYKTLRVRSRSEAVAWAFRSGVVD